MHNISCYTITCMMYTTHLYPLHHACTQVAACSLSNSASLWSCCSSFALFNSQTICFALQNKHVYETFLDIHGLEHSNVYTPVASPACLYHSCRLVSLALSLPFQLHNLFAFQSQSVQYRVWQQFCTLGQSHMHTYRQGSSWKCRSLT